MKTFIIKINKSVLACLIFPLVLSPPANANKIMLNPIDGVSLHEIMAELGSYRACMDEAQKTASKGKSAYKKAQSQQCNKAFVSLGQLVDKQSLKSIDKLSWHRWHKRDVGAGFSVDQPLKSPSALMSGVKK